MAGSSSLKPSQVVPEDKVGSLREPGYTAFRLCLPEETKIYPPVSISLGPGDGHSEKKKKLAGDDFIASWISTHKILVVIRPCILQCPGTTLQITAPKYLDCDKFMDLSVALDGLNGAWRRQSIMLLS